MLNISLMIFNISIFFHLPFEHEKVAIIGLMLSVTTSSCQCGTNEPSGNGFQPHSIGQVYWF